MKLAFFGSSSSFITSIIYRELCRVLKYRRDIELVAVVNCDKNDLRHRFMQQDLLTTIIRYIVFKLFSKHKISWMYFGMMKGKRVKDINSPEFIQWLKSKNIEAVLSVGCAQKFGKELIDNFYCVNYHNSLLPKYRGLYSMSWPVYFGEEYTGFTFHKIAEKWDSGNVLLQKIMPVFPVVSYKDILYDEVSKTIMASANLNNILSNIIQRTEGSLQEGLSSYYGQKELDALPKNKWTVACFGWNKAPEEFVPKWILSITK